MVVITAFALDYPHSPANYYDCTTCHDFYSTNPYLMTDWTGDYAMQDDDDTPVNHLCRSCHYGGGPAAAHNVHSYLGVGYATSASSPYGGWQVQCSTCHNPHYQEQFSKYRTTGDQYWVVKLLVDTVTVSAASSTLKAQGTPNWTNDAYKNMKVFPNINARYPVAYKITGNTSDTLTIKGQVTGVASGNTFAIIYGRLIRGQISLGKIINPLNAKSGFKTVKFFRDSADHSFSDGNGVYDGVCEVCHTETQHFQNDGSSPNQNHTNIGSVAGTDCTMACHTAEAGFRPSCNICHGYPPVVNTATGAPDGLANNPAATGSTTAGAHNKHVNIKSFSCRVCHNGSAGSGSTHVNNNVTIGFSLFEGAYSGGSYDGQSTANYDSSQSSTMATNSGSKTCSNIYCHGRLPNGTVWGGGAGTTPQWDGSVTCTSCHDTGGSQSALSGKHRKHTDGSTYAFACEKCHYDTASGSSSIRNEASHANNSKDLVFAKGGSFDSGIKSCTSTYCHSSASGGPPNVSVKWTDAISMQCDSCHNGRTGVETLEMSSNGHARLVSSQWVRRFPCYYCHDNTVDTSDNLKDYSRHLNETKDIAISSNWNITGKPAPSYNADTKVCDNIYCHSDGTTVDPQVRPFPWTQGHAKCNTCHGHEQGTCSTCHIDGRTGWPAGQEWKSAMPMYTNTGAGTEKANTHKRHLLTDFNCDNCHANTIANGTCTTCHNGGTPVGSMDEVNHINPAYHVNKVKDIAFKNGGTYNQVNKTCSNTACHTSSDPQWGDSVNNLVLCLTCHGTSGADVDDFTKFNGTRAKINMAEWETAGHGRPASAGNYTSGNPPANFPGNPCWYCHDNNILHNDAANPFRLKQHNQFERRFEKECIYCHMEGLDSECLNCHNASNSLAPQLSAISDPPYSQDHTGYTNGLTSCVAVCHATDAQRHNTGAGLWTAGQKVDIKNQYVMMGVCLVCHDDDSNGRCTQCHTGEQYQLGYNPGTGFIKANVSKATSIHFGYKHYAAYQNNGVWKGGKFCWDCHDPHGDGNIYMVQNKAATETDGTFGIPVTRRDVSFTRKQSGLDYAKTSAPYNGICNVCHSDTGQHYRYDYGDGHNSGRICTTCHEHRFTDSHASGKACNTCHLNKPVPRHTAFGLPRDCTKCHNGTINGRIDVVGQLKSNSHHVQGVTLTNKHCYACHWEATDIGLINTDYHSGYNYKTHASVKNASVDLVIWGSGTRPFTYASGTTAMTFTANKIGTVNERTEVAKVTQHCLGCHSDQNKDTQPFNIVDPDNGDCKTPAQYAWDRTSIAARYSQAGTTTWGKYTTTTNAARKDITKAFSAHGNATNNQGGWDASTGLDGVITNTRNGTQNIQCFDCHSSHGSKAAGVTSSYKTFNGTNNGANLKETQAGKGGYSMTYKAQANTSGVNPYNAGAGQCFDCHETQTSGSKPWGYESTFGAAAPILGYKDTTRFGQGTKGSTARYAYRSGSTAILGGHLKASSSLKGLDGTPGTGDEAMGTINGLCTPCHDPHGVSPSLGIDQSYAVPLLKGTWLSSPFKEDTAPTDTSNYHRYDSGPDRQIYIERTTFGAGGKISEDESRFAGLCLTCHPKERLTDGTKKNTAFRSLDRLHESVKGWGNNAEHNYSCSKCHQPHSSGLPRLLQTSCMNDNHRGRVTSGGAGGYYSDSQRFPRMNNVNPACHDTMTGTWNDQRWNNVSPW